MAARPVILVVGGGYVGLYTALRLQRKLSRGRAEVVVVDPQPALHRAGGVRSAHPPGEVGGGQ